MEMKQGKPKCETHKPNGWEKAMGRAKWKRDAHIQTDRERERKLYGGNFELEITLWESI